MGPRKSLSYVDFAFCLPGGNVRRVTIAALLDHGSLSSFDDSEDMHYDNNFMVVITPSFFGRKYQKI